MTAWQQIAMRLGKDQYRDLYWSAELPNSWSISPSQHLGRFRHIHDWMHSSWINDIGVEIRLNNLGWRSDYDYDEDLLRRHNILILGCSDTFAPTLPVEQTWPMLLQNQLGLAYRSLNFSWGGISSDWIARIGYKALAYLKDSAAAVCVLWPQLSNREFVSKRISSGIHTHFRSVVPYPQYWNFIDWKSNNYNYHKNRHLLSSMSATLDVPFFDLNINRKDRSVPWDLQETDGYVSLGLDSHRAIADYFHRKIQGRPSYWQEKCSRSLCDKT